MLQKTKSMTHQNSNIYQIHKYYLNIFHSNIIFCYKLIRKIKKKMFKSLKMILLLSFIAIEIGAAFVTGGRLTSLDQLSNINAQIMPASFSSPVSNLHDYMVTVLAADPFDGCSRISMQEDFFSEYPVFLMIDGDQGKCGYRRRAQLAKEAGVKGVIILDDEFNGANDPYQTPESGTFFVFLTRGSTQDLRELSRFTASINMQSTEDEKAIVEIWVSSLDDASYETLKIWNQTLKEIPAIKNKVKWAPHYVFFSCLYSFYQIHCQLEEFVEKCACGGKICSPANQVEGISLNPLVREDMIQKQIFRSSKSKYFNYVWSFYKQCYLKKNEDLEICSIQVMKQWGINAVKVQNDVNQAEKQCTGNLFESLQKDEITYRSLGSFPAVIVDRKMIEYKSKSEFQAEICKNLGLEKADGCVEVIKYVTIISTTVSVLFMALILGGLLAVGVLAVTCYRRTLKKQMEKQIKMQVSTAVDNHYVGLHNS